MDISQKSSSHRDYSIHEILLIFQCSNCILARYLRE